MPVDHAAWRGLFSNANPHLLEPGFTTEQVNCWPAKPGALMPRRGVQKISTTGGSDTGNIRSCMYIEAPHGHIVAMHNVAAGTLYYLNVGTNAIAQKTVHELGRLRPVCFARDRQGTLYGTTGVSRGLRWNLASTASSSVFYLGFDGPTTQPTVGVSGAGGGAEAGDYTCAVRFIDADGNYSNPCEFVTVTAAATNQFDWSSIPTHTPADNRGTKRQLLRSLVGETDTLYAVTTINDDTTTVYTDTLDDDTLAANDAVPVTNADGTPNLERFTPPPLSKPFMCYHRDRMWYYGETIVTEGTAAVTNGNASVTLSGATFTGCNFAGWKFAVDGDFLAYTVSSSSGGTLTLSGNYGGTTGSGKTYKLYPDPDERRQLYWSETDEPESVPALNASPIQENTGAYDRPTGLFSFGGYLWAAHTRHLYRITFVQQPRIDLSANLAADRGLVNNRCVVVADEAAYCLDEFGIYRLTPQGAEHISNQIDDVFSDTTLDWSTSEKWHADYEPREGILRWYVMHTGESYSWPRAALCYSLETKSWWSEQYQFDIQSSCLATISNRARGLVFSRGDRALLVGEGTSDWVSTAVRGTAETATSTTISDGDTTFNSAQVGAPVAIVYGTGRGQIRIVSAVSAGTLTVSEAWTTTPDSTSVYLLGAINWSAKTGLHDYSVRHRESPNNQSQVHRELRVDFEPTTYDAELQMEVFQNHETTAAPWKLTEHFHYGLNFVKDDTAATMQMKRTRSSHGNEPGFVRIAFDSPSVDTIAVDRCMSSRLSGYQGLEQIEIHRLSIYGVDGGP